MRLPNGERAVIDEAKLVDYCLSPTHPRGRHKAKLFAARFGFNAENVALLREALKTAAASSDAEVEKTTAYGVSYRTRSFCTGPLGGGWLLCVWIVDADADFPRLLRRTR